jgi:hypothetical protein
MKNPSFTFTPCKPKKYIGAVVSLLIGWHAIFIFKIVGHRFWPRLMAAPKKTMG